MEYDTSLATEAYELADRWDTARDMPLDKLPFSPNDVAKLSSNQKSAQQCCYECVRLADVVRPVVFVERLQTKAALPLSHVKKLGEIYRLDSTGNVELRFRFFQLALGESKSDAAKVRGGRRGTVYHG
jgi:leukotriene-A4 hydrolase